MCFPSKAHHLRLKGVRSAFERCAIEAKSVQSAARAACFGSLADWRESTDGGGGGGGCRWQHLTSTGHRGTQEEPGFCSG